MALSAAALAELSRLAPDEHYVLELAVPGGTRRYADVRAPVISLSQGGYQGRITRWGAIYYAVTRVQWTLEMTRTSIEISDFDRSWTKLVEGPSGRAVKNSVATVRIASPNIPQAEWPVVFAGRIEWWEGAGPLSWRIKLRTADDAFRVGKIPRDTFTPYDFPNAPNGDLYGKPIPYGYGILDSTDGTLAGAVGACPAFYCNAATNAWYASCGAGHWFHIERVFKDGTILSASAWSRQTFVMPGFQPITTTPPFLGRRMTFIHLGADPGNTARITFDGVGFSRNGIGEGAANPVPITNALLQMRHFLNNFVLPSAPWRNGPWLDWNGAAWVDHPLLESATWDAVAAECERRSMRGSRWLGGDSPGAFTDGLQELNHWAGSHGITPYWTPAGKLAVKFFNPSAFVDLGAIAHLRAIDAIQPLVPADEGSSELATQLSGDTWQIPTSGGKRAVIEVRDTSQSVVDRAVSRPWATARQRMPWETLHSVTGVYVADRVMVNGANTLFDGASLVTWHSLRQFGTQYHLTAATSPTVKLGAKVTRPSIVFPGTARLTGTVMSNLITSTTFTVHAVIKVTADGDTFSDATPYNNPAVWCDSGGYVGLHVMKGTGANGGVNGQNYLQAYIQANGIPRVARVPIDKDRWYIVRMALYSQSLSIAIQCFTEVVAGTGGFPLDAVGNTLFVGRNYNATGIAFFTGEIYALAFQSIGDLNRQGAGATFVGGGWQHLMCESIADILRMPESEWV